MPTLPNYIASNLDDSISEYLTGTGSSVPGWVLPGATVDLDFANGRYFGGTLTSLLSITRASNATDLLPSSASGYAYNTFSSNILAISPTFGLLIFEARTNLLLNSNAPATQTTASLGTGTYTLWCNGSGSVLASGGTATITGAAPATNGSPNTFTVTVAGTVTATVTGLLNAFQLESGAFGTSFIVTAGATATRAADSVTTSGAFVLTTSGSIIAQTSGVTSFGGVRAMYASVGSVGLFYNGNQVTSFTPSLTAVGTVTLANLNKCGFSWNASGRSLVFNNGTLVSDATASTGTIPAGIGGSAGSFPLDGVISRLTAWNTRLPDATLKANTA